MSGMAQRREPEAPEHDEVAADVLPERIPDPDFVWFDEDGQPWETGPPELNLPPVAVDEARDPRVVDLTPFLDGTYIPPVPELGGCRDDNVCLLYPERWHTVIAPTTSGKSWLLIWHAIAEMRKGNVVVYAHFEEYSPAGTIDRIKSMAPDLDNATILRLFVWLDCSYRWDRAKWQKALPKDAKLVLLDGINAACSLHGWVVDKPEAVGEYRSLFVTPATKRGAAVLSAGHPPKARDRQDERHGFGASGWLDEVDGVSFRLLPSTKSPIRRGEHGLTNVYTVKDRYSQVEIHGELGGKVDGQTTPQGWTYIGSLHVDSRPEKSNIVVYLTAPEMTPEGKPVSKLDLLAGQVLHTVAAAPEAKVSGFNRLKDLLKARKVTFRSDDLGPALLMLETRGLLHYPEVEGRGAPRPIWLSPLGITQAAEDPGVN